MTENYLPQNAQPAEVDRGYRGLSAPAEGAMPIAVARASQEVQAAMLIAKAHQRSCTASQRRIIEACHRESLARVAVYQYPRGGTQVTGPSIRLAEMLAQNWGNLDFGIIELDQRRGESTVMAYCWDLETNTRQTKIFTVPHIRYSKEKGNAVLTDPRDIYEIVANQGARRLRSCILGIIPGDIVEEAVEECDKTLAGDTDVPLSAKRLAMVQAFEAFDVTQPMLEARLARRVDDFTDRDLATLRKIYSALKDGFCSVEDHFDRMAGQGKAGAPAEEPKKGMEGLKQKVAPPSEPEKPKRGPGRPKKVVEPPQMPPDPEPQPPEDTQEAEEAAQQPLSEEFPIFQGAEEEPQAPPEATQQAAPPPTVPSDARTYGQLIMACAKLRGPIIQAGDRASITWDELCAMYFGSKPDGTPNTAMSVPKDQESQLRLFEQHAQSILDAAGVAFLKWDQKAGKYETIEPHR